MLYLADTLCRAYLEGPTSGNPTDFNVFRLEAEMTVPLTQNRITEEMDRLL